MKKHTRIYLDTLGFTDTDYLPCEICSGPAKDIHHIEARGMGGSKTKDYIDNLMGVCRQHHLDCENLVYSKEQQKEIHKKYLKTFGL